MVDILYVFYNIDFILERGKWYSGQVNIKHLIQYIKKEVEVAYKIFRLLYHRCHRIGRGITRMKGRGLDPENLSRLALSEVGPSSSPRQARARLPDLCRHPHRELRHLANLAESGHLGPRPGTVMTLARIAATPDTGQILPDTIRILTRDMELRCKDPSPTFLQN